MTTSMYFRSKRDNFSSKISGDAFSTKFYDLAISEGCRHDEAANFQGWAELAGEGECYDCMAFYAEII